MLNIKYHFCLTNQNWDTELIFKARFSRAVSLLVRMNSFCHGKTCGTNVSARVWAHVAMSLSTQIHTRYFTVPFGHTEMHHFPRHGLRKEPAVGAGGLSLGSYMEPFVLHRY